MGNTNSSSTLPTEPPSLLIKEANSDSAHDESMQLPLQYLGINNIRTEDNIDNDRLSQSNPINFNLSKQLEQSNGSLEPLVSLDTQNNYSDLLDTLCNLPSELKQLDECGRITEELFSERQHIISRLREIAAYLEKTHADVLIADRVGTGVGITSGLLTIGGLMAAPFTAGISLGLTIAGIGSGIAGGVTSAGANITGYILLKNALSLLKKELEDHNLKIEKLQDLMNDSSYLRKAIRLRPMLSQLGQLSEKGFVELISILQTLISLALKGNYAQINKIVDHHVDPTIKDILSYINLFDLNPQTLHALAQLSTLILNQIHIIYDAVKAFVYHLSRPELAAKAMLLTSLSTATARTTKAITNDAAEVSAAFKGTPLAMSKTARYMTGAFTAAFIVVDIIHMTRICQETGNTPTVEELRTMANLLEKENQLLI